MGKGGSAVPKLEMEQGGFFSGDFSFVYSDKTGFQELQLVLGTEQQGSSLAAFSHGSWLEEASLGGLTAALLPSPGL